jgi:hypothetical protein
MVKVARLIVSVAALACLVVSQMPTSAQCQMGNGSILARACPMPCCKAKLPMSHCPFLKASSPRDFIVSSAVVMDSALVPLPDSLQITLPGLRPLAQVFASLTATLRRLFAGPPLSVRAPPSGAQLLDA